MCKSQSFSVLLDHHLGQYALYNHDRELMTELGLWFFGHKMQKRDGR
jgi:hypothetical protein